MLLNIVIDTSEQQPWHFPGHLAVVSLGNLNTGDYALADDQGFAIERKSVNDFTGTTSTGWKRFLNEIERMEQDFPASVVIVEGNIMQIVNHEYNHPKVLPPFLFKQIAILTLKRVSVLFADNPITAAGLAYTILKERSRQLEPDNNNSDGREGDLPEA
jgi:ERCC4-type nuclease